MCSKRQSFSSRGGILALLAAAILLSGCGAPGAADATAAQEHVTGAPGAQETPPAETTVDTAPGGPLQSASGAAAGRIQDPTATAPEASPTAAAPVRVSIPTINVDAPLEVLSLDAEQSLQPPVAWDAAGWYDQSPIPGERGPSVIAGHLVAPEGPAVFVDLGSLEPGDQVNVTQADGSIDTFAVDRTISAERTDSFPTTEIYGPTPDAQLRLITCDGQYDPSRGHWTRNMVVFATRIADTP